MISDQDAGATTDEDLLKEEAEFINANHSPTPPPLPPRTMSTSSFQAEDLNKAEEMLNKEQRLEEDSVEISMQLSESPKAKPKVVPRKLSKLTKSSSSSLDAAPMVDRSLKPNIPKPLKSPRKKRHHHTNNALRHMYSHDSNTIGTTSKNAPGSFSFQGKSISEYPLANFVEDSDSNSSDFEEFVPPQRRKFISESKTPFINPTGSLPFHSPLDRRGSSPFPSTTNFRPQSKEYQSIKKSSPILTRRPTWFSRKMTSPAVLESIESPVHQQTTPTLDKIRRRGQGQQSKASRKKKGRSRSLDTRANASVGASGNTYSLLDLHSAAMDSDENTGGTVDSSGYARPFEHINSWRKLIGMDDGSAFSGSLPYLADNVSSAINNDDDSDTYLDPKEIAQKLDRNMSQKVRKRLDTVMSNTYLQLVSVQPPQFADMPPIQPPNVIAATPVEPSNGKQLPANGRGVISFKEKWENKSLDFVERPDSCLSGYTSDALSDVSSMWAADRSDPDTEDGELDNERAVNPYDEIRTGGNNSYSTAAEVFNTTFDDAKYSNSAPVDGGEGLYSVIDEVLLANRRGTDAGSLEGPRKKKISTTMSTPPLPKPRVKKVPLSKQDSGIYARLDETDGTNVDVPMEAIKDTSSDCRRPPTPPPRRHRNISTATKGSDYDEALSSSKHPNIPGVSMVMR